MRILIADDNDLVRRGIAAILASDEDCCVCGEAGDGAEALRKGRELLPDVILVDISMPGMNGWEAAALLLDQVPGAKIVIVSQNDASLLTKRVAEIGIHACIDKSDLSTQLLPTIAGLKRSDEINLVKAS